MQTDRSQEGPEEAPSAGNLGSGEGGSPGVPGVAAVEELPRNTGEGTGGDGGGEIPPDAPDGDEGSLEVDSEDTSGAGDSPHKGGPRARISAQTFRAACIAGNGNRGIIAAATGLNRNTVNRRIAADPELRAKYGDGRDDPPSDAPNGMEVMNRSPEDLPESRAVELFGSIEEDDLTRYRNGLRAFGVSEARLAKLKSLEGLAKDWPTHVAISLRGHHQSFDGQLHNLGELADDITERLKGHKNPDGSYTPLNTEDYTFLAKTRIECVKEHNKGLVTLVSLTEAMFRMVSADKNKGSEGAKAAAGWGPMKKVRAATG